MEENRNFLKSAMEREASTGRLQSLKLPRDLSLGLNRPKKQYAPNLNVVRSKDKAKEFLKKIEEKRKEKPRNKQNKHDGKQQRYLQSAGVFSQGTADIKRSGSYGEKRVSVREGGSVSNMVMPTINRNAWTVNKKSDEAVLDELTNGDCDSEDDEKMSFAPLTISQLTKQVKKELNFKNEDGTHELPPPFGLDIYTEENPSLSVVKLPDSFAGKGLSDDSSCKKLFDFPLSDMLEGQIGKLIIRKSGRIQMQVGSIKYDLCQENTFESREELATVTQGHNGENCIVVLGSVSNNYIMFPDYEALLENK